MNNEKVINNLWLWTRIAICLIVGSYAVTQLVKGQWFDFLATSILFVAAFTFCFKIFNDVILRSLITSLLPLASIFAFWQIILNSNLTNHQYISNTSDLVFKSAATQSCSPDAQPDSIKRNIFLELNKNLLSQCSSQIYIDGGDMAYKGLKVVYMDPATGFIDSIYSDINKKKRVTCQSIAKDMNELCPGFWENNNGQS